MRDLISNYLEKSKLVDQLKTVTFHKGEIILRPQLETVYLHEIKKGLVKVYTFDSKNKEKIGVIYGRGDLFPLAWMINKNRPAVYFEAMTKCEIMLVPIELFQKEVIRNIELSNLFAQRIAEQFALYATIVNNLTFRRGQERLAYRLLILAERFGAKHKDVVRIPNVSHQDLGASTNLSRENINREMVNLVKLGAIEYDNTYLTIKDKKKLQEIIGKDVSVLFFDNI